MGFSSFYNFTFLFCAGVWTVGNIGREEGSIWWPLLAAYATYPLYFYSVCSFMDDSTSFALMVFASAYAFDSKAKQWRRRPKPKRSILRLI